ncbi:MAG: hypothetical protein R2710_27780 [Acidimicrobiales bacterium]
MVAEAVVHPARVARYLQPGGYHQSFNFDLLETDWDARQFHTSIERSMRALEETPRFPRGSCPTTTSYAPATRYGLPVGIDWYRWSAQGPHDALDVERGARRARAIALVTLALPGSAYIYQGEELGLPEVWDLPVEVLRDPTWEQSATRSRDATGAVSRSHGTQTVTPWASARPNHGCHNRQSSSVGRLRNSSTTSGPRSALPVGDRASLDLAARRRRSDGHNARQR